MGLVVSEAAEALIGVEGPPVIMMIDKSWIQHFAHSIAWPNPPNPLYYDEEYAKNSRFGGIIAPPTYATRVRWAGDMQQRLAEVLPEATVQMNGGNDYEILRPIRPGDVLTGRGHLASLKESPRPDGSVLLIVKSAGRVDNQNGERVLNTGSTGLRLYGPDKLKK